MDRQGRRPELLDETSVIGAHFKKYQGLSKRLMLALYLMRCGPTAPWEVSGETAEAVTRLIDDYLEPHARRIYGYIDSHPARDGAVRIARWLRAGQRTAGSKPKFLTMFTVRDVLRCGWSEFKKDSDNKLIIAALEYLEAMRWIDLKETSGRRSLEAHVLPEVFERR